MSEKLNEQAREQQAYHNTVVNKVLKHQALNDEDIKYLCPVAFKDKMTKAEINRLGLSKHYSFVPTMNVVNDLRALGYEVVDAKQVSARKKSTDGGNAFTLSAGIFRLVCSNGLVIKTEDYGSARLVHKGYSFEAVQKLVKEFEVTVAEVLDKITAMKKVQLTKDQQIEFAKQAALLRFKSKSYNEDNIEKVVNIDDLLNVERKEDAGNGLYEVFNRVQESLINGKYTYLGTKDKPRKARPIKNFKQNIEVNKKLSELAFELV